MAKDDKYAELAKAEFRDEARDRFISLQIDYSNIRSKSAAEKEGVRELTRDAEKVMLCARSAEAMVLYLTMKRLVSFLEVDSNRLPHHYPDIDAILDVAEQICEGEIDDDTDQAEFLRSLPTPQPLDTPSFGGHDVEILLVEPQRTTTRLIANQVQELGYSVTPTHDVFEALKLAVSTKPDMILASVMQKDLSGISLARAFKAVEETQHMPVAILTSFAPGNKALEALPDDVALVDKGKKFKSDLIATLRRFEIIPEGPDVA